MPDPRYRRWPATGNFANIASRLEAASDVNRVNISAYTYDQVRNYFDCDYRGKLGAKGKGEVDMYYVLRQRDGCQPASPNG